MERAILSVVIPTRDRWPRLRETLEALGAPHDLPGELEVIVVDDGSRDQTLDALSTFAATFPLELRWLENPGRGPAAARNAGIAIARGDRVLLLGDDTRPAPGALAEHLRHGPEHGVQGHVDWDPNAPITEVMRFLAPQGPQFYFKGLKEGEPIPYTAVLGSNYSAPRSWFHGERFDEHFPAAAFEDTELAYRFARRGRLSLYAPRALCWHHHAYDTIEPFLARQRRAGVAARYAVARHPRMFFKIVLEPFLFGVYNLLRHPLRLALGRARPEDRWDLQCRRAFLTGWLTG